MKSAFKYIGICLFVMMLVGGLSFIKFFSERTHWEIRAGMKAPNFSVTDIDGNVLKLSDFQGKYILLDFWFTQCSPCKKDTPQLITLQEKLADELVIIGVSSDRKREDVKRYIKKQGLIGPQVMDYLDHDHMINKLYHIPHYPTYFLIDPEGIVVDHVWDPLDILEKVEKWRS